MKTIFNSGRLIMAGSDAECHDALKPDTVCRRRSRAFRKPLIAGLAAFFAATMAQAANINVVEAGGYTFTNFEFPNSGNVAGTGTNLNGIANNGAAVGFTIDNNGNFTNLVRNPDGTFTQLNLAGLTSMAFGINSGGDVVGQQNNAAFFLPPGGPAQTLAIPAGATTAFGINDQGNIVGQFLTGDVTPGFYLAGNGAQNFIQINAPTGPNIVNAQGVNANGLVVGFYVGNDGQDHGFRDNIQNASNGILIGSPVADPTIPVVPGEPGATFVFSQILGVDDNGIAVGYYGDSTTSQHGFLYNTNTGVYTFLDDPSEQFNNGVEITQITGITNTGELSGFYTDSAGIFHGFVACPVGTNCATASPVPEPATWAFVSLGLCLVGISYFLRRVRS